MANKPRLQRTLSKQSRRLSDLEDDQTSFGSLPAEEAEVDPVGLQLNAIYSIWKGEQDRLQDVEQQIYKLETAYLQNGMAGGNLVRGYSKLPQLGAKGSTLTQQAVDSRDRMFSGSSLTGDLGKVHERS